MAAVLVALGIGTASILQTQNLQKRERRERLLNEIIEWAEDIQNASVTPNFSGSNEIYEVNILMRYGASLSGGTAIEAIVNESFHKELLVDFYKVINTLAEFMCVKLFMTRHTWPSEWGFSKDVIDKMKNEINKKPIEDLFIECATKLTGSVKNLLKEAIKIKAGV